MPPATGSTIEVSSQMTHNNRVGQGGNPYGVPIKSIFRQIRELEWTFPFFTQVLVIAVFCLVLALLALLYVTVGVVAHVSSIFAGLIEQARQDMSGKSTIEKTGFIVAIGIYLIFLAPLWLIQLPFLTIGWIWEIFGYFTLVLLAAALIVYWIYASPIIDVPILERFIEQLLGYLR